MLILKLGTRMNIYGLFVSHIMYTLGEERADFCGVLQSRLQLMLINLLKCDLGYSYTRCYSSTYTKGIFWCLHYHRTYGYWSSPNYSLESKFIGGALSGITLPPTIKDTNTSLCHIYDLELTQCFSTGILSVLFVSAPSRLEIHSFGKCHSSRSQAQ